MGGEIMKKVAVAVAVSFSIGAGAMVLLGTILGSAAEAASVGLAGAGLVGTSYLLGGRLGQRSASSRVDRPVGETRAA